MKEMSVIGYPTFVVLNQDGVTLDRWIGYEKPMFMENAMAVVKDPTTIEEKFARYEANPTAGDAAKLAGYHDSRGESMEAVELYRAAAGMDPDDDYAMPIFESTFYAVRKEKMEQADLVASADAVFSAPKPEPMDMLNVAMMMGYMGRRRGRSHHGRSLYEERHRADRERDGRRGGGGPQGHPPRLRHARAQGRGQGGGLQEGHLRRGLDRGARRAQQLRLVVLHEQGQPRGSPDRWPPRAPIWPRPARPGP